MIYFLLFFQSLFSMNLPQQESLAFSRGDWSTNAVYIMKDGQLLYEKYDNGFNEEKPHRLWSVTKSLSSLLIGMRLEELSLPLHEPIKNKITELKSQFPITVKHLLQMSSGLKWNEYYESNPFQSDVVAMLYLKEDMGSFTAKKPSLNPPGLHFSYSSGETNLLMYWFRKTFKDREAHDNYPWKKLFEPMGIQSATWEQDRSGTFVGSSYGYMTAKDLAKIGQLILQGGSWKVQGEEEAREIPILSSSFLKESFRNAPAVCSTSYSSAKKNPSYGFHWWLNHDCIQKKRPYPNLPEDLIMALGHHGQVLAIFPSQKLVAVRFGADKKARFPLNEWLETLYKEVSQ